jgi:uncharacterized membrane protein required for colicin V production
MKGLQQFMGTIGTDYNWFDGVVFALLAIGFFWGRLQGMSHQLLGVCQWVATFVLCGKLYLYPGGLLVRWVNFQPGYAYVFSYLMLALGIKIIFVMIQRAVGKKLMASDIFGRMEYPLGVIACQVRLVSMMLVFLALLNAKYVSQEEMENAERNQRETWGVLTMRVLGSFKDRVFQGSLTGRLVKYHCHGQLVVASAPSQ